MPFSIEKWIFTFLMYPTMNTLIPTKCRGLPESILREKTKIDSSTILDIWFSKFLYSHPLHWHILEKLICQIFISPYLYQWGGILVLRKQFGDDQFIWLRQWAYCGIWEVKEDMVRLNPVGARSLEGLGALGRLGLKGLLLFVYPNFIL